MNQSAKDLLASRIREAEAPKPEPSRDILRKRPCLHAECINSSTCKKAATYGGIDV